MKKLTLLFVRMYRKSPTEKQIQAGKPGTLVYVYKVSGEQAHIDAYLTAKSKETGVKMESIKDKDGSINFFSIRFLKNLDGSVPNLIETSEGKWVADTAEADQLANLTEQYGFEIASKMMQKPVA